MGTKYTHWIERSTARPKNLQEIRQSILAARSFSPLDKLDYGDFGLEAIAKTLSEYILTKKKIALYADYDVDGTMSCVSWIWFFKAIGFTEYVHHIPCRFNEGYGVNLNAVKTLIHDHKVDVIITMDTGITANIEAEYCKQNDVLFICTDHHKIQAEKIPDALILNPKMHSNPLYQELCGCGITFVLLRKMAAYFPELNASHLLWIDLVSLAGMATICDVVPLNPVNHKLANLGVKALAKSERKILKVLREKAAIEKTDEQDFGFRLGPRINAVGRLEHADYVIKAFIDEDPEPLVQKMNECNELRKKIQLKITSDALARIHGEHHHPVIFLGDESWHPGVIGIAASKIVEKTWKPTWLFQIKDGVAKGSARSIPGFDITEAMVSCKDLFLKFGGHGAAGGYSFSVEKMPEIKQKLIQYAEKIKLQSQNLWESRIYFDFELDAEHLNLKLLETVESCKPFGNGFEEPRFLLNGIVEKFSFLNNKLTGEPKHSQVFLRLNSYSAVKIMFFNEVLDMLENGLRVTILTSIQRNVFRGVTSISYFGNDIAFHH